MVEEKAGRQNPSQNWLSAGTLERVERLNTVRIQTLEETASILETVGRLDMSQAHRYLCARALHLRGEWSLAFDLGARTPRKIVWCHLTRAKGIRFPRRSTGGKLGPLLCAFAFAWGWEIPGRERWCCRDGSIQNRKILGMFLAVTVRLLLVQARSAQSDGQADEKVIASTAG